LQIFLFHELNATGNILHHGALHLNISDRIELKQDTVALKIAIAFVFPTPFTGSEINIG
jgi:hypothetical protein